MAEGESWKAARLVGAYLSGIRGGIPLAQERVDLALPANRSGGGAGAALSAELG